MSGHTQDGRVWAVQASDGRKVRVHPDLIKSFPSKFKDLPSAKRTGDDKPVAEAKAKAADTNTTNQKEA